MYWMARPPYLRWAIAALVLAAGIWTEMTGPPRVLQPYLTTPVTAGQPIEPDDIEWRPIPADVLDAPDVGGRIAAVDLEPGTPLVEPMLADGEPLPDGWWAVAIPLPLGVAAGAEVRVVVSGEPGIVTGRVVAPSVDGGFGIAEPGLVAVPENAVASVANAALTGSLVVAVAP